MKNALKIGLLAIVISTVIVACDPPKAKSTETPVDSPKTKIDTPQKVGIDTTKKDTTKK